MNSELVLMLAPRVHIDEHEPFDIEWVAGRLVDQSGDRFLREPESICVEFVLGWSGDVGHIVESEWLRVYAQRSFGEWLPAAGVARPHGRERSISLSGDRVDVWAEPGKHGLTAGDLTLPEDILTWMCTRAAGWDGVFPFGPRSSAWGAAADRCARRKLQEAAFTPKWKFNRVIDTAHVPLVPWDQLEENLLDRARDIVEGSDAAPVTMQAGGWDSDSPFLFLGVADYTTRWTCAGSDMPWVLSRARSAQKQLIVPVAAEDIAALPSLWEDAWLQYCSSLVLIVGTEVVAREAIRLGFHAACLVTSAHEDWGGGWVATCSSEVTEELCDRYQVVGPGPADIALEEDLCALLGL